jgi:transcriptional regulator with XRE-family HTH domain
VTQEIQGLSRKIAARLRAIRESVYVSGDLNAAKRKAAQQEVLARQLGVAPATLDRYESGREPVPAAVLLRLMERYGIRAEHFLTEGVQVPPQFQSEQRQQQMTELIARLQAAVDRLGKAAPAGQAERAAGAARPSPLTRRAGAGPAAAPGGRKGGWLKGLPRRPKTEAEKAIVAAWKEARAKGVTFSSIDELMAWKRSGKVPRAGARPPARPPSRAARGRAKAAAPKAPAAGAKAAPKTPATRAKAAPKTPATRAKAAPKTPATRAKAAPKTPAARAKATPKAPAARAKAAAPAGRKGGWLKGLPRRPKTDEEKAIVEAWKEARMVGYSASSIEDLMRWKAERSGARPGETAEMPAVAKEKPSAPRAPRAAGASRKPQAAQTAPPAEGASAQSDSEEAQSKA